MHHGSLAFAGGIEAQATEPDLWASASTLDVPVLLLLGVDDDGQREPALGRQLVQALPAAELVRSMLRTSRRSTAWT